jgi:hypothetical protein
MDYLKNNEFIIDSIVQILNVPRETVEKGLTVFLPVGGLLMLLCFFLISRNFPDTDDLAYLTEIEQLEAAKKMGEEEKEKWLQKKYEQLKASSSFSIGVFSLIDTFLSPNVGATINDALKALSGFNPKDPFQSPN